MLITSASLQATISKAQLTRWQMGSLYGYIWRDVSTALPFPQLLSGLKVNVIGCAIGENTDARTSSSCLEKCASLWTTVVCTLVFRSPHDASAFVLGEGRRSCEFIQRSNPSLIKSFPRKRGWEKFYLQQIFERRPSLLMFMEQGCLDMDSVISNSSNMILSVIWC